MIRLVAFDLDGTVADTLPLCIRSFQQAVSPYAGHALAQEEITALFGKDETGMVRILAGERWNAALEDLYRAYTALHGEYMPFDGIVPLIEMLRSRGVMVAMITGKGPVSCAISLEKFGIKALFSDVLTGSAEGCNKKERLLELMEKRGVSPQECVYVGDSVSDAVASKGAGVLCLSAAWGSLVEREALERINPGYVFASIAEVGAWFEEQLG